jgi:succinate dehydrogenase hydrophobic anchor subunit
MQNLINPKYLNIFKKNWLKIFMVIVALVLVVFIINGIQDCKNCLDCENCEDGNFWINTNSQIIYTFGGILCLLILYWSNIKRKENEKKEE